MAVYYAGYMSTRRSNASWLLWVSFSIAFVLIFCATDLTWQHNTVFLQGTISNLLQHVWANQIFPLWANKNNHIQHKVLWCAVWWNFGTCLYFWCKRWHQTLILNKSWVFSLIETVNNCKITGSEIYKEQKKIVVKHYVVCVTL